MVQIKRNRGIMQNHVRTEIQHPMAPRGDHGLSGDPGELRPHRDHGPYACSLAFSHFKLKSFKNEFPFFFFTCFVVLPGSEKVYLFKLGFCQALTATRRDIIIAHVLSSFYSIQLRWLRTDCLDFFSIFECQVLLFHRI